ncbi:MAG: transposase [Actinomycetota bacterium]|nr:transposase [Actinomycetota bacterium]
MPYPPRPQFPGGLYHVTFRGVNRRRIVVDDVDRELWLGRLAAAVPRTGVVLHSWCLMTNHGHLVVETPHANVAEFVQIVNSPYARSFNRRHGKVGHVFGERYASRVIEKESHLLEVARYVVLNPVRAGICERAEDWRWSSYRATAGLARPPAFLTTAWLLAHFARDRGVAAARYAEFVAEGAPAKTLAGLLAAA